MGTQERWNRIAEAVLACTGHETLGLQHCRGLAEALDGLHCGIVLHRTGQMVPLYYNAVVEEMAGVAHAAFGPATVAELMPRLTASAFATLQAYGRTFGAGGEGVMRFQCGLLDSAGRERMYYGQSQRLDGSGEAPVLTVFFDVEMLVAATLDDRAALTALTPEQSRAYDSLTTREREVLALVVANLRSEEIAKRLFIAPQTVQTHRKNLKRKLGVRSAFGFAPFASLLGA